jgi:hypothetical protein
MLTKLIWLDFIRLYWWDEERIKACHTRERAAAGGRGVARQAANGRAWLSFATHLS